MGHDILGQHLHHANFTRPSALGIDRVEIAAREKFQRGENLGAEKFGAAAIMGEGHQ